jgi:hypothetical protein
MRAPRRISVAGRIATPNRLVSPLTGTRAAAFHVTFRSPAGEVVTRVLGDSLIVHCKVGGIRVDVRTARLLFLHPASARGVPTESGGDFAPFVGMDFVEGPLPHGARVHLSARVQLDPFARDADAGSAWMTCPATGDVTLTLLDDPAVRATP